MCVQPPPPALPLRTVRQHRAALVAPEVFLARKGMEITALNLCSTPYCCYIVRQDATGNAFRGALLGGALGEGAGVRRFEGGAWERGDWGRGEVQVRCRRGHCSQRTKGGGLAAAAAAPRLGPRPLCPGGASGGRRGYTPQAGQGTGRRIRGVREQEADEWGVAGIEIDQEA